jgi:hypothetical protein
MIPTQNQLITEHKSWIKTTKQKPQVIHHKPWIFLLTKPKSKPKDPPTVWSKIK